MIINYSAAYSTKYTATLAGAQAIRRNNNSYPNYYTWIERDKCGQMRTYTTSGIRTIDPLVTGREHEPLHQRKIIKTPNKKTHYHTFTRIGAQDGGGGGGGAVGLGYTSFFPPPPPRLAGFQRWRTGENVRGNTSAPSPPPPPFPKLVPRIYAYVHTKFYNSHLGYSEEL